MQDNTRIEQAVIVALEGHAETELRDGRSRELSIVQTKLQEALMWESARKRMAEIDGVTPS